MAKYPYIALPRKEKIVYKPWIRIRLGYSKSHKVTPSLFTLIDSGADVCFCLTDIGVWLGIKNKHKSVITFKTANKSKFEAFKEIVNVFISGEKYSCPFYFSPDLPPETPIILGQEGFFDRFKITFNLPQKEMEII